MQSHRSLDNFISKGRFNWHQLKRPWPGNDVLQEFYELLSSLSDAYDDMIQLFAWSKQKYIHELSGHPTKT